MNRLRNSKLYIPGFIGGWAVSPNREISMAPVVRDPVAGLPTAIGGPAVPCAVCRVPCPWGWCFDFVAKWFKKWFCEIVDDPW